MAIATERSGDVLVLLPQGRLDSNNAAAVESDRRRAFIELTEKAADGMARYFAELGKDAKRVV